MWFRRRPRPRRRHRLDPIVDRHAVAKLDDTYRASTSLEEFRRRDRQQRGERGAVLIEAALVMPLLTMVIAGGLLLGLAAIQDLRLEYVTQEAASGAATGMLAEDGVAELIETAGAFTLTEYVVLTDRVVVTATAETIALPFFGTITPESTATAMKGTP